MFFEHLQGWGLHHCPGQPGPKPDHSFSKDIFPDIQSKPPLTQLEAIASILSLATWEKRPSPPHYTLLSGSCTEKVPPQPSLLQTEQPQLPQPLLSRLVLQTLHKPRCPSLDTLQPLHVLLGVRGPNWTQHSRCSLTSAEYRGTITSLLLLALYSWYKPGCRWPSWPPGHTADSCPAGCPPTPQGPFLPGSFPAPPPQACSAAWGCCDQSAGPGIWPCWTSYRWIQPSDPACPDPSAGPSHPPADARK